MNENEPNAPAAETVESIQEPGTNPPEPQAPRQDTRDVQPRWKGWLQYLGGIAAFVTLVSSGLTFTVSKAIDIYQKMTWKEKVVVVSFRSVGPQVFLNAGDGDVLLSHIDIKSEFTSQTIPINNIIKPREFLSIPKQPDFDFDHAKLISQVEVSDDDWNEFLSKPLFDPAYHYVFLFEDDPILQLYKKTLGPQFRSYPASAQLIYYSANAGKQFSKEVPMWGIIMHVSKETNFGKK